jgi:hypothetical protein
MGNDEPSTGQHFIARRGHEAMQWMQNRANVSTCINNVLKDLHWKERECKNAKGEKVISGRSSPSHVNDLIVESEPPYRRISGN